MGAWKKRRQYRAFCHGAQWLICLLFCNMALRGGDIPFLRKKIALYGKEKQTVTSVLA